MPRTKKRNANKMGSIRQVTSTRCGKTYTYWQARYTEGYDPGTGKQIQRTISGKTQKEVREKLTKATRALDKQTYIPPSKQTVGEWFDHWFTLYLPNIKPRTREIYESIIRVHIRPALGAVKLEELTTDMIQNFYHTLKHKKKLSAKSIKNIHGVVHKALKQAVALRLIPYNPTEACTLTQPNIVEQKPLEEQDVRAFLQKIRGHKFEALMRLALFTGMREGEVLGLEWSCVDFNSNTLHIKQQLNRHRTKPTPTYSLGPVKQNRARTIKLPPSIMTLLETQKETQALMKAAAGSAWEPSDYIFTNEFGGHLVHSTVSRQCKQILIAIGRPDANFHRLRHSYATIAIELGDDLKTVQKTLGHATEEFTLKVYTHVTEKMKTQSAERMEAYIQKVSQ